MLVEVVAWLGFGLIFGSFTNVLILRHETDRSLGGRSACPACGTTLRWFELFPVLSWLLLRGRCASCGAPISLQYPTIEALTGAAFLVIGLAPVPLVVRILGCAIAVLLIAIAVYDIRHFLMPDRWVFGFAGLALISSTLLLPSPAESGWLPYVFLLIAGPLIALPLWLLWFFSGGKWMGFGDVKFAVGMGWLLGAWHGYLALTLSFVLGAIVGVCILLPLPHLMKWIGYIGITRFRTASSGFTMKSEVPFGPFLILGTCIVWFLLLYSIPIALIPGASLFWSFSW